MLLAKAQQAAERARALSPDLADAHVALAYLRLIKDWDYAGSDSAFRAVIARYPRHPMAHKWYGDLLHIVSGPASAMPEIRTTLALDPKLAIAMYNFGYLQALLGQPDSALVWLDRSLALAPDLVLSLVEVTNLRGVRGDSVGMFAALTRLQRVSSRTSGQIAELQKHGLEAAIARCLGRRLLRRIVVPFRPSARDGSRRSDATTRRSPRWTRRSRVETCGRSLAIGVWSSPRCRKTLAGT